jgi:hypothetical protein
MSKAHACTLSLSDPSQWPLYMTRAEVAHVLRRSPRTIERRIARRRMPQPTGDGMFLRDEIEKYIRGGVRAFDRQRQSSRGGGVVGSIPSGAQISGVAR